MVILYQIWLRQRYAHQIAYEKHLMRSIAQAHLAFPVQEQGFHVNLLCDRRRSNPRLKEATHWHYDWMQYIQAQLPEAQPGALSRRAYQC